MYQADHETGEIYLYDGIGDSLWGMIDAATVMADLSQMSGRRVTFRISSPGGSVEEGRLIYNAMQRHNGGVDVIVDSAAYSIASHIAVGGVRTVMAKNSMMMIHSPLTLAWGNAAQLREIAGILDKYGDSVIAAYAEKSGKDYDEIKYIMDGPGKEDGTWYTAQEAVDAGFADSIGDTIEAVAASAPTFPKALFTGRPKGEPKATQPAAGTRTPALLPSREIRLRSIRAMLGR
jgi:ATP-dependent protease ClpP protease subunit